MLGFHQLPALQLVRGDRLNVELDVVLREPRAQRFEIVGEVVEDPQIRSQGVDRDARVGRKRAEVLHHLRLHRNLILGQRVQRVDDDRGDVARRPWRVLGTVGEEAWRDRFAHVFDGVGTECRTLEPEERDRLWLPVLQNRDLVLLEIGHGLTSLIGRDNREFNQRRAGPEDRRGLACCAGALREGEAGEYGTRRAHQEDGGGKFSHPLTVEYRLTTVQLLVPARHTRGPVQEWAMRKSASNKGLTRRCVVVSMLPLRWA